MRRKYIKCVEVARWRCNTEQFGVVFQEMREVLQSFQRDARVRSVEESNGAEAWRLIHSRYAPDTQNRQYALMQKIMMLAKLWYDHAKGFQ